MKFDIPNKVLKIIDKFQKNGSQIYVVGGAVRDLLIGKEVKDWDFTTNLVPEEMKKLFPKNGFYYNNFGTFSILGKDKEIFEVTTYRTEREYSDNRHPDMIKWGKSLEEDLSRRDFTINAMALKIEEDGHELIDIFGGQKDLDSCLIRTVNSPTKRFKEDALRMMRAVRIASELSFVIEDETFKSIQELAYLIKEIAFERIKIEFIKILLTKKPGDGIKLLKNSSLLNFIIPELLDGVGMMQKGHHVDDVWTHNLKTLDNCISLNPITRLACLLHDVGKPKSVRGEGEERTFHNHELIGARMAMDIGKRLKLSREELEFLFRLVRWHMFTTGEMQTDKAVRRFIKNVTIKNIEEMIKLRRADRLGSGAKETSWRWELFKKRIEEVQKQPFSIKDLKINGLDVMKVLDIKPGPKVGKILSQLFKEVEVKPELNQREILLDKINEIK